MIDIMVTAKIETQIRTILIQCSDLKNAISTLQGYVINLLPDDGRCRFAVLRNCVEIYSWTYKPTFREPSLISREEDKEDEKDEYINSIVYYVLIKGNELLYDNLYHNAQIFDSITELHSYMKEMGYSKSEYNVIYELSVESATHDEVYGFGLGFTKEEARVNVNKDVAYYGLKVLKNDKVKEL